MNFLGGIPLGRWFGIRVVLSWLFIIYAVFSLQGTRDPKQGILLMVVLFGTVLLHEFGHALTCKALGGVADLIVLWPLGGLAFVNPPPRPWPQLWTTIGGPAVNVVLIPVCWGLLRFVLPLVPVESMAFEYGYQILSYGLLVNILLLVFNLLPVYPMDGGRIVQEILWMIVGYPRSLLISGMTGTVGGLGFIALGLGLAKIVIPVPFMGRYPLGGDYRVGEYDTMLIWIGLFVGYYSFRMYRQAQTIMGAQRR